jgi:hypothetical protein
MKPNERLEILRAEYAARRTITRAPRCKRVWRRIKPWWQL